MLEKIKLDFTIENQFCTMCPKLYIFKEKLFINFEVKYRTTS